jgi:head-tail adaptor
MAEVPSKWLAILVVRAARLRAAGNSWEAVARVLGCRPQTCQRWQTRYASLWTYATRREEEERYRASCELAERQLRVLLRSANPKYRLRAADLILRVVRREPTALSPATVAEAERVRAAEGVGRVRVVPVTANEPPAEGPPKRLEGG